MGGSMGLAGSRGSTVECGATVMKHWIGEGKGGMTHRRVREYSAAALLEAGPPLVCPFLAHKSSGSGSWRRGR